MEVTTYSKFRQNLKSYMDKIYEDSNPLYVTRTNGEDVVVMSKDDYEGLKETIHLMSNPKNAQRLLSSIKELENGGGQIRELIEE